MKTEILADLYGLRAGLSLISQKIDEKKKYKRAMSNSYREIATATNDNWLPQREKDLQKELWEEKKITREFQTWQKFLSDAEEAYEDAANQYRQRRAMSNQEKISHAVTGRTMQSFGECYASIRKVTLIPMMIISAILLFIFTKDGLEDLATRLFACSIAGALGGFLVNFVVALLLTVLFFITIRPSIKRKKDEEAIMGSILAEDNFVEYNLQTASDNLKKARERVSELVIQLENQRDRIDALKRNYQKRVNQNIATEKNLQQQIIGYEKQENRLYQEVLLIENRLDKVYASTISKADWENIDLLIHYFETGRADTMKEALQLVDRQRQTNQITNAIYHAGRYIGQSLSSSMRELGSALSRSFSIISQQLSGIQQEVAGINDRMNNFSRLAAQSAELSARGYQKVEQNLSMQVKALDLQNALLEKANVSSEEMVKELRNLKQGY